MLKKGQNIHERVDIFYDCVLSEHINQVDILIAFKNMRVVRMKPV
jgi:hypothetical protein